MFIGHREALIILSPYTMNILKWPVASIQCTPLGLDYLVSIA